MITREDKQQHTKHWNLTFLGAWQCSGSVAGVWLFRCGSCYWHRKQSTLFSVHESMQVGCSMFWSEWTSTHQRTNVDGWCTDRILFSIPAPSQVHSFCLPFLSPDLSFFLLLKLFPTTYSSINLQCASLIPTHLPTPCLFFYLPTL
jgi:hypothetical protein